MNTFDKNPDINIDQFIADSEKMTCKELSEKYGRTENVIYYWCTKLGCHPKKSEVTRRKDFNMEYVKECLQTGLSILEVSELVGVSNTTIYTRLKEDGISVENLVKKKQGPKTPKQTRNGFNCRPAAKTHDCIYWDHGCRCCDYMLKTGKRRPCPAWDCTVYKKGSWKRDTPWANQKI